jgi:hypothetical protein
VRGSGNREDIDTEKLDEQPQIQQVRQVPITPKTEVKETIPFKKPIIPLPEHMKVTSIKDTSDKNKPIIFENSVKNTEPITIESEQPITSEIEMQPQNIEVKSAELEPVFASLQDCWIDCIKESSTQNTIIAVELLSKQTPVANENHSIEIEIPNEVAKQEIREILPTLAHCLNKKTGISYSFDFKTVKTVQEKQVDKSNPDEIFMQICKENPKLMDFKQRLGLSVM